MRHRVAFGWVVNWSMILTMIVPLVFSNDSLWLLAFAVWLVTFVVLIGDVHRWWSL